jgi:predicted amidohydrolase YtcJ
LPVPDLILYNGRIYPDSNPRTKVEAVAIWKGRVTDLGSSAEILSLGAGRTTKTNLRGSIVLPGFFDSHIHLLNYGMMLRTLDLSKTKSIDEIKGQIAKKGPRTNNAWILGRGWDDEKLREHRYPNRHDLDQIVPDPVFLKRVCGHVAVANSKALQLAGVGQNTPDPEGGIILRDSDGQPNGILKERAIELVERAVPQSVEETRKALVLASRKLARLGITSLQCIISDLNELVVLRRLKRDGEVPQSIYAIVPLKLLEQLLTIGLSTEKGEEGFRIGGVKLFLDGSLGARTAALGFSYNDDQGSEGMLTMTKEELEQVALRAKEVGFQLCIHAIGDRAVDLAIQVLHDFFGARGCREFRHRIEHASLVSRKSIREMRRLGITASVQPRFIYSDSWAGERLGPERLRNLYPFASFYRNGVTLAAGSDCPVEDPNPFEGIWSAILRPRMSRDERLTVRQVLQAYSARAAYACFCEDVRGTLEPGKRADMAVIDRDPFESDPEAVRRTRVLKTIIGGRVFS